MDVGANQGYFTLQSASLVGPEGAVHAFEPSPQVADLLEFNCRLNSRDNITLHRNAVSNECGIVEFNVATNEHCGLSSMRDIGHLSIKKINIPSITLDSIKETLPYVKLVKIDVEGAEFMILQGMCELIQRDHPYIIFELTNDFLLQMGSNAAMVVDYLTALNYTCYEIQDHMMQTMLTSPNYQCNILGVPDANHRNILPLSLTNAMK